MFQINDINKEIAKRLSVDIKVVERINNVYYKELVHALNVYTAPEIKLTYLGTFKARFSPVKRRIWVLIKLLKKLKKKDKTDLREMEIKARKEELNQLWKIKNEFAIKTFNKIKKNVDKRPK